MRVYTYQGDIFCEDCAAAYRPKDNPSEDWQGPFPEGGGEADAPQHCGMGAHCVNADTCPAHDKHPIGIFLENPLTTDGRRYVEQKCREDIRSGRGCVALDIWAPFYGISLDCDDDSDV